MDQLGGFAVLRRLFEPGKPVEEIGDALAFLRGHCCFLLARQHVGARRTLVKYPPNRGGTVTMEPAPEAARFGRQRLQ
jgi:hypothetical protein